MKISSLIIYFLLVLIPIAYAEEPLRIVQLENSFSQMITIEILKAVYKRLDIPITIVIMPSKRALTESQLGRIDGEAHRIFEIGEVYPTLIRVPTPINYIEPTVFSKNKEITITGIESIKGYRLGVQRGVLYAQLMTEEMENVVQANTLMQLIKLLDIGRIDMAIMDKINGLWVMKILGIKSIYPLSPSLNRVYAYHYLHEKNHKLVSKVDQVLQEMKANGELDRIRTDSIKKILGEDFSY